MSCIHTRNNKSQVLLLIILQTLVVIMTGTINLFKFKYSGGLRVLKTYRVVQTGMNDRQLLSIALQIIISNCETTPKHDLSKFKKMTWFSP